jgi:DNA-binding NtrC family response regulator
MSEPPFNRTGGHHRVLLVGPDSSHQDYLGSFLEAKGFRVIRARAIGEACQKFAVAAPHVLLADLGPLVADPYQSFAVLLEATQSQMPPTPLIVLNKGDDWGPVPNSLTQAGAHFLSRPLFPEELLAALSDAMSTHGETSPAAPAGFESLAGDPVIGRSPAIQRVLEQVRMVGPKNTTVLITGETGTGKERVSQAVHWLSGRRRMPMISVNCGGIPAALLEDEFFGHVKGAFTDAHQARIGRFEQAHRGTIFLDEIGDLPLELQPKLLRVLQEREIHRVGGVDAIRLDVRVIAATNIDLWGQVNAARFREDLFYRINVFPIHLPPLRERREDIPAFIEFFVSKFCRRDQLPLKRLRSSAEAELMSRPWPGNIRELENAVEIAVIRSRSRDLIEAADFPPARPLFSLPSAPFPSSSGDFKSLVQQFEKDLILRALERTQGNKSRAAQILRLKRTTLIEKLKKFTAAADPSGDSDDERHSGGLDD